MIDKENDGMPTEATSKRHWRKLSNESTLTEVTNNARDKKNALHYQSVGDVPKKSKQVGKIRKNSACSIPSISTLSENQFAQTVPFHTLQAFRNDIMTKIKLSQMTDYNKMPQPLFSQQKESGHQSYFNTISGKYQLKMEVVLGSFEARKQQIDEQIFKIKNRKKISIDSALEGQIVTNQQTPKFASKAKRESSKNQEEVNKKSKRGPQWTAFMTAIKKQIELDEKVRNIKHQIQSSDKIEIIYYLNRHNFTDVTLLSLQPQQYDPFFKPSLLSPQEIALTFMSAHQACQLYWQNQLQNRFEPTVLETIFDSLSAGRLEIQLKDLVRQLGVLSMNQKYLRNRDLYSIYKRLVPVRKSSFIEKLGVHS